MCASYNPPIEDIPTFNSSLFNQPEEILSQAEADKLYLSKTKNDTSTAALTTFNNQVNVGTLNTIQIKSATPASSAHTLFDNMIAGGTLTIGNMTTGTSVALKGAVSVGQSGTSGGVLTLYRKLNIQDINGNATGFGELVFGSAPELGIYAISVPSTLVQTFVRLYSSAAGSTASILRFEVGDVTKIFNNLEVSSRLSFTGATYSFPFASSQSLGYYLKTTGSTISTPTFVTATPTSIVSVTIPIGVWRIDFSVQNVVGSTGAGTISSAQSYISTTSNGAVATAVAFTGSIIRSHVAEVYANNDIQIITGSITYNQTTSGLVYLNIVRSFSTGQYNFTGELGITRIA